MMAFASYVRSGNKKYRRFNAGLQRRMLGRRGWAVIWRSEREPAPGGALSRGGPVVGGAQVWGRCSVSGREWYCGESRCGDRQEQGKRLPIGALDALRRVGYPVCGPQEPGGPDASPQQPHVDLAPDGDAIQIEDSTRSPGHRAPGVTMPARLSGSTG